MTVNLVLCIQHVSQRSDEEGGRDEEGGMRKGEVGREVAR